MTLSNDPMLKLRCKAYAAGALSRLRGAYNAYASDAAAEHIPVQTLAESFEAAIVEELGDAMKGRGTR